MSSPNFAYYYPQQITFQPLINNAVKPAIAIGDNGSFLAFQWFYGAVANLKSGFPAIAINITAKTITIDFPLEILGGAGACLKVGCIYIPLLSSMLEGVVSPSTVTLTLTVDENEVSLYAKPSYPAAVNVRFYNTPMVDVLLNILMGSFGNNLISTALKNAVNKMNFKLFDFQAAELQSTYG